MGCCDNGELESQRQRWQHPAMSTTALEQTVSDLQRRVSEIEGKIRRKAGAGWRKIAGAAKDDTHFSEAMKLGAEWRKKANKEQW